MVCLVGLAFEKREKPRHITPRCGGAGSALGSPSVTMGKGQCPLWPGTGGGSVDTGFESRLTDKG